jgi:hypothetical protein
MRTFLDDGTKAKVTVRDADDSVTLEAGGGEAAAPSAATPPA